MLGVSEQAVRMAEVGVEAFLGHGSCFWEQYWSTFDPVVESDGIFLRTANRVSIFCSLFMDSSMFFVTIFFNASCLMIEQTRRRIQANGSLSATPFCPT